MKKLSWLLSFLIIGITTLSIVNNRRNDPNFLDDELSTMGAYFEKRDVKNITVSEANVAWHIDHILKTINRISESLVTSNPSNYRSKFNFRRIVVHTTGRIPRGVAQSPQSVRLPETILLDSLYLQLEEAKQNLKKISQLEEKAFFNHPVFDDLDRDQTRRFLEIHTNHHLKIIEGILNE